jgi:hypothetical protein
VDDLAEREAFICIFATRHIPRDLNAASLCRLKKVSVERGVVSCRTTMGRTEFGLGHAAATRRPRGDRGLQLGLKLGPRINIGAAGAVALGPHLVAIITVETGYQFETTSL